MNLRFAAIAATPLALAAVDYAPSDFGGSITPIGAGARALGMGGAFTAIADDATANTWNPAGMTQLERPEAAISGGYYGRTNSYAGETAHEDDLQLDHLSLVLPLRTLVPQTLAVAWQRQYDFTSSFALSQTTITPIDPDTNQVDAQEIGIEQRGSFAALGASYAIEPVDGLSFGVTVWRWDDDLTQASSYDRTWHRRIDTHFVLFGIDQPPIIGQTVETTHVAVDHGTSVVVGVLWRASSALNLALDVKPRYRLSLDHQASGFDRTIDVGGGTDVTTPRSSHSESTLQLPTSVTVGAAWRLDDLRTLALDVGWTRWSEFRDISDAGTFSPLSAQIDPDGVADGWSVRLGYEQIFDLPRLLLVPRVGALWEQLPGISPVTVSGGMVGSESRTQDWYGATVGLGIFQRSLLIDLGAQVRVAHGIVGAETPADRTADVTAVIIRGAVAYHF